MVIILFLISIFLGYLSMSEWADLNSSVPLGNYEADGSTATASSNRLEYGYYVLSGTNLELNLVMGLCSLSSGGKAVGSATYSLGNGTISLSFFNATEEAAALNGNTYVYTIKSSTSFSGHGETWTKR
jgi:hypothetical protein